MVYFHSNLLKEIEYPMEATRLNNTQWEQIMKPLLPIALQKTGIKRTFTIVMVYTSKRYQGLGVKHPWYNQQLKHLQILIREKANKTPI